MEPAGPAPQPPPSKSLQTKPRMDAAPLHRPERSVPRRPDSPPPASAADAPQSDIQSLISDVAAAPVETVMSTPPSKHVRPPSFERALRRFYAEMDRHVSPHPISEADVQAFTEALRVLPLPYRIEGVRRAVNLIPDANVDLLKSVVLDKAESSEVIETVFHDVVNRPEEVKKPILDEILKDKTHPCYSDAEWIYEVTGEKPSGDGN